MASVHAASFAGGYSTLDKLGRCYARRQALQVASSRHCLLLLIAPHLGLRGDGALARTHTTRCPARGTDSQACARLLLTTVVLQACATGLACREPCKLVLQALLAV